MWKEWWGNRKDKRNRQLEAPHPSVDDRYQASALSAFIRYVNAHKEHHLSIDLKIQETDSARIGFSFENEKTYITNLSDLKFDKCMENPELLVGSYFKSAKLNRINDRFHELETSYGKELKRLAQQIDHYHYVYRNKTSDTSYQAMLHAHALEEEKREKERYYDVEMTKLWRSSPFFAKRLEAVYFAFLREAPTVTGDPVEADLLNILQDDDISPTTKEKAEHMLAAYRIQKQQVKKEVQADKENQALLTLSTIEQHYLKGGMSRVE